MGARKNERERLINLFIVKIFKCKADKNSKPIALIKLKKYVALQGKRWNDNIEQLFESTWERQVPATVLTEIKREEKLARPAKVVPARVRPNRAFLQVEIEAPEDDTIVHPTAIKPNRTRVSKNFDKSRFDEPEPDDLDDEKWDVPVMEALVKEEKRNRKCANCDEPFVRLKNTDPMMLCEKCSKALEDSFNDSSPNYSYASEEDIAIASEIRKAERNRILNIKPL
jgi:hypothetical protein